MAVAVVALQQTHKLLHHQEGHDPAQNPQPHGHDVAVVGSCAGGEERRTFILRLTPNISAPGGVEGPSG